MGKITDLMDVWLGIAEKVDNRTISEPWPSFLNKDLVEEPDYVLCSTYKPKIYCKQVPVQPPPKPSYWDKWQRKEVKKIYTCSIYEFIKAEREAEQFERSQVQTFKIDWNKVRTKRWLLDKIEYEYNLLH